MADIDIAAVVETVGAAESIGKYMEFGPGGISVVDATGATAEAVTVGAFNTQMWRGANTATIGQLIADYQLITHYPKYRQTGFPLKGLILIPGSGGPDTFAIKDGSDSGPYLYKAPVSAATVLVYPGTLCLPYVDYSECTLSTGHLVTFVW
jgi:hypothetical protein